MQWGLSRLSRFSATSCQSFRAVLNSLPMKVYLRNRLTRLFCADSNGWAVASGQAFDFTSVSRATTFALDEHLPNIELVLMYYTLPQEVALPLLPEWRDFAQPTPAPN